MTRILGSKYQTYINDELVVFRIINIKNEDKFTVIDNDGKKISITEKELSKFVLLKPDAIMNIMTTETEDEIKDVYVCIHNLDELNKTQIPNIILRQNIYSASKNTFGNIGNDIFVGECINTINCSKEDLDNILEFKTINHTLSVALYVDDKYKDIITCIGHKSKKFDEELKLIKSSNDNTIIKGYCESLDELLTTNDFMSAYREMFNITQVDFDIYTGDNISDDGVISLSKEQLHNIEDLLRSTISNVNVLKYDKDIDISKIVDHTHIVISDRQENIYLVSYTTIMPYEEHEDIDIAMGLSLPPKINV